MTKRAIAVAVLGALLFAPAVSATPANDYSYIVDTLYWSESGGGASVIEYETFNSAIAKAYGVQSVLDLKGRLAVLLLSDVRLRADIKCFQFGCESIQEDSGASALKVALVAYLLNQVDSGRLDERKLLGSRTVEEHMVSAIADSDNDSANALLNLTSYRDLNQFYRELGFHSEDLHFGRAFSSTGKKQPDAKLDNTISAKGLAKLYLLIAQESDVSGFLSSSYLRGLRLLLDSRGMFNNRAAFNDRLNGGFPVGINFYHKTGANEEVIIDGGYVVDGKNRFVLVAIDTKKDRKAMSRLGLELLRFMRETQQ